MKQAQQDKKKVKGARKKRRHIPVYDNDNPAPYKLGVCPCGKRTYVDKLTGLCMFQKKCKHKEEA